MVPNPDRVHHGDCSPSSRFARRPSSRTRRRSLQRQWPNQCPYRAGTVHRRRPPPLVRAPQRHSRSPSTRACLRLTVHSSPRTCSCCLKATRRYKLTAHHLSGRTSSWRPHAFRYLGCRSSCRLRTRGSRPIAWHTSARKDDPAPRGTSCLPTLFASGSRSKRSSQSRRQVAQSRRHPRPTRFRRRPLPAWNSRRLRRSSSGSSAAPAPEPDCQRHRSRAARKGCSPSNRARPSHRWRKRASHRARPPSSGCRFLLVLGPETPPRFRYRVLRCRCCPSTTGFPRSRRRRGFRRWTTRQPTP